MSKSTTPKKKYTYVTKALTLPDGSRKFIRAATQEELDEKVMKELILINAGVDISSRETFGHFAQMWYELYKEPLLRSHSKNTIKYVLNIHILPYLGDLPLNGISPMQIQLVMNKLANKSYSLQSKVLVILRNIFKVAQENGLIMRSPVSSMLKAGGKKAEEKVPLTPEESKLLLERVVNKRARTFLLIALHTGMRRGEIVALKWSDIDFEKKVIYVRHNAVMEQHGTTITDYPKTDAGKRDIPLSEELEQWLVERKANSHSQYVLAMENHKPLTVSAYRSMWNLIGRELPDKHFTAHSLRHTFITRLFEAGMDMKEVQYLAGHSKVELTMQIYTHYDRASRAGETSKKLRKAFAAKEPAAG